MRPSPLSRTCRDDGVAVARSDDPRRADARDRPAFGPGRLPGHRARRPVQMRTHDGAAPVRARSALIAPYVRHQLTAEGEQMLFCHLDPASARSVACKGRMTGGGAPC